MKKRATSTVQLDMFDILMPPPVEEAPPVDHLGQKLIETGLVYNSFQLDLNHSLTAPMETTLSYPWDLPSRLFRFPVEVSEFDNGVRRIGLMHPLLGEHPFVKHVEATLGCELAKEGAPNKHGYSKVGLARWWHAVDLMHETTWQGLLDTRPFTTDADIIRAVGFAAELPAYRGNKMTGRGQISTETARSILAALGCEEPADRSRAYFATSDLPKPSSIEERNSKGAVTKQWWPINLHARHGTEADATWLMIHAIEDKLFRRMRNGHLEWSEAGRALKS